jgi:hypothetical protein
VSRGPGIWQRGILAAVASYGMVYLRDLLPDHARKSDRNAVERAAWRLVAAGRIELHVFWFGRPRLLATRPGWPVPGRPPRAAHRPLSVGDSPAVVLDPHLERDSTTQAARDVDARIGGQWPAYRHTRHGSVEAPGDRDTA